MKDVIIASAMLIAAIAVTASLFAYNPADARSLSSAGNLGISNLVDDEPEDDYGYAPEDEDISLLCNRIPGSRDLRICVNGLCHTVTPQRLQCLISAKEACALYPAAARIILTGSAVSGTRTVSCR